MQELENFWNLIKQEETLHLATAGRNGSVTMRTMSPVPYQDNILLFTSPQSEKYRQLRENPLCCLAVGGYFLEAEASFPGHTMLEENAPLREAYTAKFPGAFDEGIEFGGRDAEFVLLRPLQLKGWTFENGMPVGPFVHNF